MKQRHGIFNNAAVLTLAVALTSCATSSRSADTSPTLAADSRAVAAGLRTTTSNPKAVEARVDGLLKQMTLEEKIDYIGGDRDFYIRAVPRLGIPEIKMSDGPVGVRNYGPTTAYPAGICLAATWNPELAGRFGTSVGHDARARGVHIWLAPGMNIYRAPMCGRNFEYLGEDPYLASRIAVPLVQHVQAEGVLATIKHFAANNQEYERNFVSSDVDERTLREIYLATFKACVQEGGAACVMDSYNLINGTWATASKALNTDYLKTEVGFDGLIMSDWGAVHDTDSVFNGGMDLEMPSGAFLNRKTLLPRLKSGELLTAVLDDKVRRVLRVIVRAGFLDRPQEIASIPQNDPSSAATALQIAREGIVLLKNTSATLPLDAAKLKSLAVIGPMSGPDMVPAGGGSSFTKPFQSVSFVNGIRARAAASNITVGFELGATDPDVTAMAKASVYEPVTSGSVTAPGLKAEYFLGPNLEGKVVATESVPRIDFDWGSRAPAGLPADFWSVRWTGKIRPTKTQRYLLATCNDDGIRVWLDNKLLIDDWHGHGAEVHTAEESLEAGRTYDLRVEYFENIGDAVAEFSWGPLPEVRDDAIVDLARRSDVAVVCVGFGMRYEGEGSDRTFALPKGQNELIARVAAANPRTVVVVCAGGNVDMQPWLGGVPALVQAWYPGQVGGTALAEILFGDTNPSGKLPATFEKRWEDNPVHDSYYDKGTSHVAYSEGIFVGYRGYDQKNIEPQFAFGHGLSYTSFEYGPASVTPVAASASASASAPRAEQRASFRSRAVVKFSVKNTGSRAGSEVAQVYVHPTKSALPRPPKELKAFRKIALKPGESQDVQVELGDDAFSYYDPTAKKWTVEASPFEILVGSSSRDIRQKAERTIAISSGTAAQP